jgi:hypothetical protein
MRKIRIIEHISLDGVIQAPGGPKEDGDYPYGGWAVPHSDGDNGTKYPDKCVKPWPGQKQPPYGKQSPRGCT